MPFAGNPINVSTGNKFQAERDYISTANPLLSWTRFYNSSALTKPGLFGAKWRSSFDQSISLSVGTGPGGADVATVVRADSKTFVFTESGSVWTPDKDVTYALQQVSGGWTLSTPDRSTETYDAQGRLTSIQRAGNQTVTLSYNPQGRLATVADASRALTLDYDSSGRPTELTTPAGNLYAYSYDSAGNLQTVVLPDDTPGTSTDNPVRTYHYENATYPSNLTGITDENGARFATWTYDTQGRATSSEHSGGAGKVDISYTGTSSAQVTAWSNSTLSSSSTYQFVPVEGAAKVASISSPACQSCGGSAQTTYDSNGFVASRTDFKGNLTTYTRNTQGQELTRVEASGTAQQRTITTQWHSLHRQPTQIDEPGRRTVYEYNSSGQRTRETVTDTSRSISRITDYDYDAQGRLESVDGPRTDVSDITEYDYDTQGNLVQITNADGHVTQVQLYDADGNPGRIVDANGVQTQLEYDARQNLISRTFAGLTTEFEYDAVGQLTKVTQEDGSFLEYDYDDAHRLTDIQDQAGNHIHYTLDVLGNRISETVRDPANVLRRSHERVYNALGELKEIHGGEGQLTTFTYDGNGNQATEATLGRTATRVHDALNRLTQVTDFATGITAYGYDALDHLTSVTDPRGLITSYTVNAFGDVLQLQSPDTGTSTSTYDAAGNLATRLDAKGQLVTYSYDALNRLTQIDYPGGNSVVHTYDQGTYGKGRLTGIANASSSTSWTYNAQGRITSKVQVAASQTLTSSYSYDTAGRLISQTLPSGKVIGLNWIADRLISMTVNGQPLASNIEQEPFGPVSQWDFANSQQVQRSFDLSGRMTDHSLGSIAYDQGDRITGLTPGGLSLLSGAKTYGYDTLDRLTSYQDAASSISYGYDANGNRTQQSATSGTTNYAIDSASNRVTSLSGAIVQSPTYDANGSLTADGNHTYTYNSAGRLSILDGINTSSYAGYTYNGLGQRIVKNVNGVYTFFAYDQQGHLQGEYNAAGTPIQETVWLGDTPIAVLKPSGTYYVHADHLNTPRQIEDQSGNTVWLWDTVTFGDNAPDEDPQSTGIPFTYNLRHPGQYFDAESGLMQNWHRDYDPATGRYMESDPIGLVGGINTYGYVGGNPVSNTDPTGLVTWEGTGAFFSAIAGAGAAFGAFQLKSECVNGSQQLAQVYAAGPAVGFGLQLTGSGSTFTFEDGRSTPDATAFNGQFLMLWSGGAAGLGYGVSSIQLGEATARFSHGYSAGVDMSVGGTAGRSWVGFSIPLSCGCDSGGGK